VSVLKNKGCIGLRAWVRQTFRSRRDELPCLLKVLNPLWVLTNNHLLDNALHKFHNWLRQEVSTAPTVRPIAPLGEFTIPAANSLTFLAHGVTSQIEIAPDQSNRLSCALASSAVGRSAVFLRFFAVAGGSNT
jgi:hypothetical protein